MNTSTSGEFEISRTSWLIIILKYLCWQKTIKKKLRKLKLVRSRADSYNTKKRRWLRKLSSITFNIKILFASRCLSFDQIWGLWYKQRWQAFINIFSKTRRRYDVIYIDEEIFETVSELKRSRLICNKR